MSTSRNRALAQAEAAAPLLRACAWCERIEHGGAWVRAELVIRALDTYAWSEPPSFTPSICPDCLERVGSSRAAARAAGRQRTGD